MTYLLHVGEMILAYAVCASALNLMAGYGGLLSVSHAGLMGLGAYTFAILSLDMRLPIILCILAAVTVGAAAGALLGYLATLTSADLFVFVTLAFQMVLSGVFVNMRALTGGSLGHAVPPQLAGYESRVGQLLVLGGIIGVAMYLSTVIHYSPFGRSLRGLREDETVTALRGRCVQAIKVEVSVVSGCLAALSGVAVALTFGYISPESFDIQESIFLLSIVIIGGSGKVFGPFFGAVIFVGIPELLRFVGVSPWLAGQLRQMIFGTALVVILLMQSRYSAPIGSWRFFKYGD